MKKHHQDKDCECIFCNCKCPECKGWNVELYFDGFRLNNRKDSKNRLEIYFNEHPLFDEPTLICIDCGNEYTGEFLIYLTGLCRDIVKNAGDKDSLSWIDITIKKDGQVSSVIHSL